eukprot:6205516-Pleurochrysis_carterae.AAC.1
MQTDHAQSAIPDNVARLKSLEAAGLVVLTNALCGKVSCGRDWRQPIYRSPSSLTRYQQPL